VSADYDDTYDFEHGWQALAGLAGRMSLRLQTVQGAEDYAPVRPWEVVPVEPCPFCADGGMRTAGYVTRDSQLLPVRQCDTCHAVEVGAQYYMDEGEGSWDDDDQ
jgi:hypothetical protein